MTIALYNKDDERMEKRKTSVKKGTLQPQFGDTLVYSIPDNMLPDVKLKVVLKGHHVLKKNSILGGTIVQPTSDHWKMLMDKGFTEGWFPVFRKPKKEKD